jgi:glycosyltransferase involved in cell wall biosynthesis
VIDVAIDARITPRMSAGMRAYVHALIGGLPRVAPDIRVHAVGHGLNFGIAEHVDLPREIARAKVALTHYPTVFVPIRRRKPYVAMVHDLIHLQFPQYFSRMTAVFYELVAIPMLRDANMLLMSDERTVEACERFLRVPRERCRIVPLGYDPALIETPAVPAAPPQRPYLFYAGNHRPHKNLATLFKTWTELPEALALDVVVTGDPDPKALARYRRRNGELHFVGALDDAELAATYRGAAAYVHPALAEGFGLPMLEATVLGTPVIASATAVPSIVAPYAVTFAPHDALALRAALTDVVANPARYRQRAAEGSVALRAYTWDRFAAATAAVYREVVG